MASITIVRQATFERTISFKDSVGTAIDITDMTVKFTVKQFERLDELNDTNAIIKKTITTHSDPTQGETLLNLTPTETDVATGDFWYDIQLRDTAGNKFATIREECKIVKNVTRT